MVNIMNHEIDLKNYTIRTDLVIEEDFKKSSSKEKLKGDIKVTNVTLNKEDADIINKKPGTYITIEFKDVTDSYNRKEVTNVFKSSLKKLITKMKIKDSDSALIIGLGNRNSTPDSLGPLVIDNILVTRHLFLLNEVSSQYRNVSSFLPGVMGNTGIETVELIKNVVDSVKPDFLIVIDALASSSVERVNKTIQISNTGINPGSGVGNNRKEISMETLNIPVISIGIPTVVDAVSVVSDTIGYMQKHYAFNKKFLGSPLNRLVSNEKINYLKQEIKIDEEDKSNLLGMVGKLNDEEIRELIYEVLTPIGYNLMVTPKEIDFVIKELASVVANGINNTLQKNYPFR
jgi:spore protease